LYAFRRGTTTPLTVYTDNTGSAAHPVPLVADADGVFPAIYNTSDFDVKVDVKDPVLNVSLPGYPLDPAIVSADGSIAAADVSFEATSNINQNNVQDAIEQVDNNWRAAKTGIDDDIVSGTAGTAGNLAQWNADGDLVDGPDVLDEDDMASDSATAVATQQSIKAYVDAATGGGGGSYTLLGTLDLSTGTPSSVTLTGLDLTDINWLRVVYVDLGPMAGSSSLQLEGDNIASLLNGSTFAGFTNIDLANDVATSSVFNVSNGASASPLGNKPGLSTASTSITFSMSSGTFSGGEIKVYGSA
jgi:hypothetical protein